MWYLFKESYSSVWEPAEGGYYVEVSTVELLEENEDFREMEMSLALIYEDHRLNGDDAVQCGPRLVNINRGQYIGSGCSYLVTDEVIEPTTYDGYQ